MDFLVSDLAFKIFVTTVVLLHDFLGTVWICDRHHENIVFLQVVSLIDHVYQFFYCWGYYMYGTEVDVIGKGPEFFFFALLCLYGRFLIIADPIEDKFWTLPSCVGDLMINIAPCIIYNESPVFLLLSLFQAFVMIIYRIWLRINKKSSQLPNSRGILPCKTNKFGLFTSKY